jgi:glutamate---cysteine ligase / carboxylate-amine ligase
LRHAFGNRFTVGIEEELMLVDPETHALAPVAERVLAAIDEPAAAHEAYASCLELRSAPADRADEAVDDLRRLRVKAQQAGATLMGAGLHPDDDHGGSALVEAERYRRVEAAMRGVIGRTPECALHVHVGMPDPDTAIRAFNGVRAHLPLLIGLAAASPWWFGSDSGLASARFFHVRSYPGRGVPPDFNDYQSYLDCIEKLSASGGPEDYTLLWWDVRPHPKLGTIELREMDVQASLDDTAAIAALVQGLARIEAEEPTAEQPSRDAIGWSSFRAARDGLDAEILDAGRLVPLREAARTQLARLADDPALEGVERILTDGNSADRQRAAYASGGMPALLAHLVDSTQPFFPQTGSL